MNRYFVELTFRKFNRHFLLSLSCLFIMIFTVSLIPSESHALTCPTLSQWDVVVVQNVGTEDVEGAGLNVRKVHTTKGNTPKGQVYDGTTGTIMSDPVQGPIYIWYYVKWDTLPAIEGWSVGIYAGTKVISTTLEAHQKDKLVEALFKLKSGEANTRTRHDYNDYKCEWPGHPYDGGHGGWDVVIDREDPEDVPYFYPLLGGELIQEEEDEYNTIAVYNSDHEITVLYLHADEVLVSKPNLNIDLDKPLGIQGNTSPDKIGDHVHIEIRLGKRNRGSAGAEASQETRWPNISPIPKLYEARQLYEADQAARGGASAPEADVNNDKRVDILDLFFVWAYIGRNADAFPQADVNGDGEIDKEDIIAVAENLDEREIDAPAVFPQKQLSGVTIREGRAYIGDRALSRDTVQQLLNIIREADGGSLFFKQSIAILEHVLAAMTPSKTVLLANYPNPFNPETWIPYQLAKPADVTLTIYAVDGKVIRQLALGHQLPGVYQNRSHAAYWDGKNELGENVASGVYFYTLTAGEFTATRKMLIVK